MKSRRAEKSYSAQLRKIARVVGDIITGFGRITPDNEAALRDALNRYADMLDNWAHAVARRMLADVSARDERAWMRVSQEMGAEIGRIVRETPVGDVMRERMAAQVDLIKSLPRDAAERVHRLVIEAQENGARAEQIAKEIMRTGHVTESRARLIARTEVGRASAELQRARAEAIGSTQFIWRTSRDSDVRPSHRKLEGKVFRWDTPPECDPGHHALPGAIFNCRCYAEPVIPEPGR